MTNQPDPEAPATQQPLPESLVDPAIVSDMTDAFITIKRDDGGLFERR